ncbi:hypothetical protein LshimejAT787_3300040 [Lyophyllum shimeji]|uniref:Uncharacterized protein n=1 Tax=Lyophyllum shimeji TaxID=47721 RepID=A0A9P3Q1D8_LYOSH|nr:hypothetical protein LshimejAT787_3300040 [Lyophyllum shimeji]
MPCWLPVMTGLLLYLTLRRNLNLPDLEMAGGPSGANVQRRTVDIHSSRIGIVAIQQGSGPLWAGSSNVSLEVPNLYAIPSDLAGQLPLSCLPPSATYSRRSTLARKQQPDRTADAVHRRPVARLSRLVLSGTGSDHHRLSVRKPGDKTGDLFPWYGQTLVEQNVDRVLEELSPIEHPAF